MEILHLVEMGQLKKGLDSLLSLMEQKHRSEWGLQICTALHCRKLNTERKTKYEPIFMAHHADQ